MTDEKPKRRPWFQLHLSTCVVLMFVAGVLVGVNLVTRPLFYPFHSFGWPLDSFWVNVRDGIYGCDYLKLCGNLVVAIGCMFTIGGFVEYPIRRRERKRTTKEPAP